MSLDGWTSSGVGAAPSWRITVNAASLAALAPSASSYTFTSAARPPGTRAQAYRVSGDPSGITIDLGYDSPITGLDLTGLASGVTDNAQTDLAGAAYLLPLDGCALKCRVSLDAGMFGDEVPIGSTDLVIEVLCSFHAFTP